MATLAQLELGYQVKLKSGGPLMTVTGIRSEREIQVCWMTDGQMFFAWVPAVALQVRKKR